MDKAEYRVMLDQMTALADAGDYAGALSIVEKVDWRRVKSVRTLSLVSEIYEENGRLEDSLKILKLAYKRGISKNVLYRLSSTCAKLGDYKEAIAYYREFDEVSPMDNSKYILKYEIYRAKGAPIEDQIRVLEDYKEREYTEQWAYELATLYSEAGMKKQCIETCDDMILWFSEGSYVTKAMELKKKYVPLTAFQVKKYQDQMTYKAPEVPKWESQVIDLESSIVSNTDVEVKATPVEEESENVEKPEEATYSVPTFEGAPKVEPITPIDPTRMQSQLADSIRAVFSGMKKEADTFAQEIEEDVKIYQPTEADMSGYEIKDLEPETVDGVDKKAEAKPFVVKEVKDDDQIEGQLSFMDMQQPEEFDLEALIAETTSALAMEVASGEFEKTDDKLEIIKEDEEIARKAAEEEAARKAAEEEAARKAAEEARKAAEEEAARKAAEEEAARKAAEEEAARKAAEEEAARKAAEEEAARKAAEEEAARKAAEEEAARKAAEEEAARNAAEEAARKAAEEETARLEAEEAARKMAEEETVRKVAEEVAKEAALTSQIYEKETDESLGLTREFNFHEELKKSGSLVQAESAQVDPEIDSIDLDDLARLIQESVAETSDKPDITELDMAEVADAVSEEVKEELALEFPEEERIKYIPVEPRPFTDKEKEIFSYFTKIPGMSQQITETIADVHNNAGDKTSRSGNFLIIGRQRSGKTKLYEAMVVAICNDLGIEAAKMARIIGRDLNKKDPAAIVAKLSGGFLVIEGAGELSEETVNKLNRAMEFRTDALVVVLEDEKADMYAMLEKYPEFAEKFTTSIKIPVFTNDELVTFAKTYANENGYRMDEMGILALYTKIGDNQKDSEPVTVGKVKEIMDDAIEHANKGTRKLGRRFSKNTTDDERVLLLEKDFD